MRILNDFKDPLPSNIKQFRDLINLSINMPVSLAKQVAAAEQIATLAIKYPDFVNPLWLRWRWSKLFVRKSERQHTTDS